MSGGATHPATTRLPAPTQASHLHRSTKPHPITLHLAGMARPVAPPHRDYWGSPNATTHLPQPDHNHVRAAASRAPALGLPVQARIATPHLTNCAIFPYPLLPPKPSRNQNPSHPWR